MYPLAAAGVDDAIIIVVIAVVVVIGGAIWWLSGKSYRMTVTSTGTSMPVGKSVTVTASFQQRTWRFGTWTTIPANFTLTVSPISGVIAPSVMSAATNAASPAMTFTVAGTAVGSDTLKINATRAGGTEAAGASLGLTVVGG